MVGLQTNWMWINCSTINQKILTGQSWAQDFLYYLNDNEHTKSINSFAWGNNNEYQVKVYKIGETYFYLSEHPQTKNEKTHVNALIEAIGKYN